MRDISVAEAAKRLQITPRRVRRMIADGLVTAHRIGASWAIDPASVPYQPRQSGQPLTERNAFALALIAEGQRVDHIDQLSASERSRLQRRWQKTMHEEFSLLRLRSMMARRGAPTRYSSADLDELRNDERVHCAGRSDDRSGMNALHFLEAYVHADDWEAVINDHMLVSPIGAENVVLRSSQFIKTEPVPVLYTIADLADAGVRERQQAEKLFQELVTHA